MQTPIIDTLDTEPIELPDPAGDGVLLGHRTLEGTVWTHARADGTVEALGSTEHHNEVVKLRLAEVDAMDARRRQINAEVIDAA